MIHRSVGSSGLSVSRLGLGTMTWGSITRNDDAHAMLRRFIDAGGDLIDTAPAYGGGRAEALIGKFIASDHCRDDLVIATKAGFGTHAGPRQIDTSRRALLSDLEDSLRRLRTDHVDLWQLHAWGDAPLEETLAALDQAVRAGMARYVGVCNYIGWQIGTAATWQAAVPGRAPLVSGQIEYSLLARRAEVEVLPALAHHGMGLICWSPLGRGVLTGKYRRSVPVDSRAHNPQLSWFVEPYLDQRSRSVVDAVAAAADGLGLSAAQVALIWARDAPVVTSLLLGARTPAQLDELLDTEPHTLPDAITLALDDITGGTHVGRTTVKVEQ